MLLAISFHSISFQSSALCSPNSQFGLDPKTNVEKSLLNGSLWAVPSSVEIAENAEILCDGDIKDGIFRECTRALSN